MKKIENPSLEHQIISMLSDASSWIVLKELTPDEGLEELFPK